MERRATRRSLPVLGSRPGGRVGLVTLGCDKNTVDSERILARLAGAGVAAAGDASDADVVVINTCGFIDVAKDESIDAILDAVRLKSEGRIRAVVAMGCLVQRYKAELEAELPEVDLFLGLTEADRLLPELRARGLLPDDAGAVPTMERPLRVLSSHTGHSSYLKISEGCDHACAFCAIPLMRGKHRSTPVETLVAEARELEAGGVVELSLISQDSTWYGRDFKVRPPRPADGDGFFMGRPFPRMPNLPSAGAGAGPVRAGRDDAAADARRDARLPDLLRALLDGTSIPWLRLFYMYPSGIDRSLVDLIAAQRRILPYLDMPIQHGSDAVLKRMRRPERRATIRERVGWLREAIPELALRTTVIVGFPGETEDDFEALLDLLEQIRFDHVGAFAYSPEEGTPAYDMADPVPEAVKRERLERLLDAQRIVSLDRNEAQVGRELLVLVDRVAGPAGAADVAVDPVVGAHASDVAIGRSVRQAPEVDGVVRLSGAAGVQAGTFVRARITGATEHDLDGVVEAVVVEPAA